MTKKWIIFTLLKIVEISVIVFYPYSVARLCYHLHWMKPWAYPTVLNTWSDGIMATVCIPILIALVGFLIFLLAVVNIHLAEHLSKRLFKETDNEEE